MLSFTEPGCTLPLQALPHALPFIKDCGSPQYGLPPSLCRAGTLSQAFTLGQVSIT